MYGHFYCYICLFSLVYMITLLYVYGFKLSGNIINSFQILLIKYNNISMQAQGKPDLRVMGGCMFAGDLAIENAKNKGILIVGDTRQGKSTLFNYIMKVPLKGIEQDGQIIYQQLDSSQKKAVMDNSFQSVTLVPNIEHIYSGGEQISLVDMAGFFDSSRSYVGIFGVSFMLQKILQKVESMKFILTINAPNFEMTKLQDFLKPYEGFVRIFAIQYLFEKEQEQLLQNLINSIAIVITRARQEQKFYLNKIKKMLDNNYQTNHRNKLIYLILKSILAHKRISLFRQATEDGQPPQSQILQNLTSSETNWNYFHFPPHIAKQSVFILPFKTQYQNMRDEDKTQYNKYTKNKSRHMENSYELLRELMKRLMESWQKQDGEIEDEKQFIHLNDLIQGHAYGGIDNMLKYMKIEYYVGQKQQRRMNKMQILKNVKKIAELGCKINNEVASQGQGINDKIKSIYGFVYEILDKYRQIFCTTRHKQQQFIIFMFINMRYIYESLMQNKIDEKQSSSIPNEISKYLSNLLPNNKTIHEINIQFYLTFAKQYAESKQYVELEHDIKENIMDVRDSKMVEMFYKAILERGVRNVEGLLGRSQDKLALKELIQLRVAYQKYVMYSNVDSQPNQRESQRESQREMQKQTKMQLIKYCKFLNRYILKMAGICLQNLGKFRIAIRAYQHINAYYMLNKCYQKKLLHQKQKQKKYQIMQEYSEQLKIQGKKQKLICLYQQMLDEYDYKIEQRSNIIKQILFINSQKNSLKTEMKEYEDRLEEEIRNQDVLMRKDMREEEEDIWEAVLEAEEYFLHDDGDVGGEEAVGEDVIELFRRRNVGKIEE